MNSRAKGRAIMLQGTASDVGKSIVTTALLRILKQDGWAVAPYKSQNMALNSYVTLDGKEIGRAQGVQAEACEIVATTDMNPILIKPMKDMHSQIVVHGKPHAHMSARNYREQFLPHAKPIVMEALDRLRSSYDVVVMEGAGSPAEINLKQNDIVNMNLAGWADAPVLLVADIDRGGVFASIVGTLELLEPHERARVKGFVINKFRGDVSLLQPGLDWLEERTGIPVVGVLPYIPNMDIEQEDSVVLDSYTAKALGNTQDYALDIAVIRYPRLSNFTDIDALIAEPDVRVRYVQQASELGAPDCIVLPGTKNTIDDLRFLRESGLADAMLGMRRTPRGEELHIVGICGGYQMLGAVLSDPHGVEIPGGAEVEGLHLLPLRTVFYPEKRTERAAGKLVCSHPQWASLREVQVAGYEIHMGLTERYTEGEYAAKSDGEAAFNHLFLMSDEALEGLASADGKVWGTYLHGIFHNDAFRRMWLNKLREAKGLEPISEVQCFAAKQAAAFDRLAEETRQALNMELIYQMISLPYSEA